MEDETYYFAQQHYDAIDHVLPIVSQKSWQNAFSFFCPWHYNWQQWQNWKNKINYAEITYMEKQCLSGVIYTSRTKSQQHCKMELELWKARKIQRDCRIFSKIDDLILITNEHWKIEQLLEQFTIINSLKKSSQNEKFDLEHVWALFDEIISAFPSTACRLNRNASIILHSNFENGIVKLSRGKLNSLYVSELEAVDVRLEIRDSLEANNISVPLAAHALNKRRTEISQNDLDERFLRLNSIICKQIFSKTGNALSSRRQKTNPRIFEPQIFWHVNKCLWNVNDVA